MVYCGALDAIEGIAQTCEWRNQFRPEIRSFETAIIFFMLGQGYLNICIRTLRTKNASICGDCEGHANIRTKAIAWEADLGFTGKDRP